MINKINPLYSNRCIKRTILSESAKILDPLGLLELVTFKFKLLIKDCWLAKVDWDKSVSQDIYSNWSNLKGQVSFLPKVQVNRKILVDNLIEIKLHGFCNASSQAYGTCIYA